MFKHVTLVRVWATEIGIQGENTLSGTEVKKFSKKTSKCGVLFPH